MVRRHTLQHVARQILANKCPRGESTPKRADISSPSSSRKCGPVRGSELPGAPRDGLGPGRGLRCQFSIHPSPSSWLSWNREPGHRRLFQKAGRARATLAPLHHEVRPVCKMA